MGRIDTKRVLLGGLAAGLVINIGETILNMVVLARPMREATTATGATMASWAIPFFILTAFIWGLSMVWLYAAVRPRLGPGPATALAIGGLTWLLVGLLPNMGLTAMGMNPLGAGANAIALVWGLAELPLAAAAGAWIYREEPVTARAAPAAGPGL